MSEAEIEATHEGGTVVPGVASTEPNPLDGAPRTLSKGVLLTLSCARSPSKERKMFLTSRPLLRPRGLRGEA